MERARPPRPSQDSGPETIGLLPSTSSLTELVEAVRSPGVLRTDVDALLRGLARPLAPDESPRARADFLLSVIESEDVGDMQGSDKRYVRDVAVQALINQGYPYALEVPPEALERLRGSSKRAIKQKIPTAGLIATAIALLIQCRYSLPIVFEFLFPEHGSAALAGLIVLGAVLGPTLAAMLGGWRRVRWLQRLGLLTMTVTGSFWLVGFATLFNRYYEPFSRLDTWLALTAGIGFLLGAMLMRRPEWLPEGTPPDADAAPQPPP